MMKALFVFFENCVFNFGAAFTFLLRLQVLTGKSGNHQPVECNRKSIFSALVLLVLFACFFLPSAKANTETVGGYTWTYRIIGSSAQIYGSYSSPAISPDPTGHVSIPNQLGGKTVTSIGPDSFYDCFNMTSVTIPNSVTSIGDSAFHWCDSLTSVTIPNSVTQIGARAFNTCRHLRTVTIPNSVISIGEGAFVYCYALTAAVIPNGVTSIRSSVFSCCESLKTVTIPDSVTSIGDGAFASCENLESITIPEGVSSIGDSAFQGCKSLKSVKIPDGVSNFGDMPFYDCSSLTNATFNCSLDAWYDLGISGRGITIDYTHCPVESRSSKSPTCTSPGLTHEVKCNRCNAVLEASTSIPALGGDHIPVETKIAKAPTCTDDGWTHEVKCSRCNAVLEASSSLPKLGHVEVETMVAQAPTCMTDGWTHEVKCDRCNAVLEASTPVPALGHASGVETKAAKAVTCIDAGWTHEVKCSRCHAVLEASTAIPALGHVEAETKAAQVPTCTEDGWTHEVKCNRCNDILEASVAVPALGHERQTTISAIAPTCLEDGRTAEVVCSRCGLIFETSEVRPSFGGHTGAITKPAVEPTSGAAGKTGEITCTRCGEVLQAQTTVPALGYIRNVTARQLWPHKKVEVCYEVANDINDVMTTNSILFLSCVSGSTTNFADESFILGNATFSPGTHVIVWDMGAQSLSVNSHDLAFSVACHLATYCIIDISGGASADNYPVTYTANQPSGGFNQDEFKTTKLVMRLIEPGSFQMSGTYDVTLTQPFYMSIYETTQKQYLLISGGQNPSWYHGDARPVEWVSWKMVRGDSAIYNWPSIPNVDPDSFMGKLQMRTGLNIDLPTEAQWEYACRAGTTSKYNNGGNTDSDLMLVGRYHGNRYDWKGGGYTEHTSVGSYLPNAWGLYDMHGNVDEWCLDWHARVLQSGVVDPTGPSTGTFRTRRGGDWKENSDCSSSARVRPEVSYSIDYCHDSTGFRIARTLPGDYNVEAHSDSLPTVINTSSSVTDGMNVSGTVNLGYSPFAEGEAKIYVDNELIVSSTNSGTFAWQPITTGTHTLKHISGTHTFTRTVNVTSLATAGTPSPQPPTEEDPNIAISSTSKSFGSTGGTGTITTSGNGTWTASASDDWITFPAYSSNTAGRPVAYRVAANSGVEERTGYIYVSGHVFTVTQTGIGAELDHNSADFETEGGTGSFTVLADAQSSWKVRSNVDWISVTTDAGSADATSGTGEAAVYFTVAPWNEVSTRSGTITAAGCTFTVNQTGRRMKISGPDIVSAVSGLSASFAYQSHVLAVTVDALSSTEWDVELDGSWLSVVDSGSGHGGGTVAIAVNENPSWLARSGSVRIGTETLAIRQEGRPPSALSFSISPAATTASVKGANAVIAVAATPDLPWTATSQANWLTIMPSFQQGVGSGNVVYSASPNPTMAARTGTITVADAVGVVATHSVSQPAATAMVSADGHTFVAEGESYNVDVATDDIVNWSIMENIDWVSVTGETNRIGPGRVVLVVSANSTVNPRSASMTIAGHPFTISQKGRTIEVEYTSNVFGPEGDYSSIDIHPDGNVNWVASTSNPDWIVIWGDENCDYDDYGNVLGVGDATLEYIVSDYVGDGTPRTGWIQIGDKTVYITQRAYELTINPSAITVGGNAGAGTVGVPASAGQIWNAIATEPWIAVVSGTDSGTGSGTVRYTYTDNDTGEERTGRIIISGEEYTITQAARQMVAIGVTTRVVTGNGETGTGNGGVVSGFGTYDRGMSVTLAAVANDGYEFVGWTLPDGSFAAGATLPLVADVDKELVASFRRIPMFAVNGESVREGTSVTFTAPAPILDAAGTTKLVCAGTSAYPALGINFTLVITGDIAFEWDLWTTNYLVTVEQAQGGQIRDGADAVATSAWLPTGSILNLTAVPDTGNSLFRWVVNGETLPTCSTRSTRLKITAPLTVSAVFGVFSDTLATALDAPALAFTTGGDADWLPVIDASAQTGYTSARSGAIGPESETWLDTTVEGPGTLTFRWRVDCEKDDGGGATWDRLSVWTNGVEATRLDGTTDWLTMSIDIPAPNLSTLQPFNSSTRKTTIRWSFYRDDWDEPGTTYENAAWVDGITFTKEEL